MSHLLLLAATTSTTAGKAKSSSSSYFFLVLLILFGGVYFLFLRPRSKRTRAAQQTSSTLAIGDEVISAGGILGTVTNIVGDEIEVEVAPGTYLTFWRRAINLRTAVRGAPQSGTALADGDDADDLDEADEAVDEPGPADDTGTVDQGPDDPTRHGGAGGGS